MEWVEVALVTTGGVKSTLGENVLLITVAGGYRELQDAAQRTLNSLRRNRKEDAPMRRRQHRDGLAVSIEQEQPKALPTHTYFDTDTPPETLPALF